MAVIAIPDWAPDNAGVDLALSDTIENVLPRAKGYGPAPSLAEVSASLPGVRNGVMVALADGSPTYFAGTIDALYKYDPVTNGWGEVSNPSTNYSVPDDDYWSFALFGTNLVATHVNAPLQVIDIQTGTVFSDLNGSGTEDPPRARFADVVSDVLVLGGLIDFPNRIAWSGLNDITKWDPGVDGSDYQEFPTGGAVNGIAGGDFGIVFQKTAIRRMIATGDPENLFQFSLAEEGRGAISPWSVVKAGPRIFFLDSDGFYMFADGASSPISAQICADWFKRNADPDYLLRTLGAQDMAGPRVFWAFKSSTDDRGILDTMLCYDWLLNRWTPIRVGARAWMRGLTLATSIDQMTMSIDDLTTSLDSSIYSGGNPLLAAFSPDEKLAFLQGGAMPATLDTMDAMAARPNRAFVRGARLQSDAPAYTIAVGGRETLSGPVAWKPATGPGRSQFCPTRCSARYHRARVVIPAGTVWSYVLGVEPDVVREGAL